MKHRFTVGLAAAVLIGGNPICRTMAEEAGRDSSAQAAVFVPFDFYPRHREELGLNEDQVREMQRIAERMRDAAQKLEGERGKRTSALQDAVSQNPIDMDTAMGRFRAVIEAENELKALQFRGGIAMRNALNPEQLGKLRLLASKENSSRGAGVRAEFSERLQQLRAEIHKRTGGEPPPEIIGRLKQIEQAAQEGRFGEAKGQLEQLLRQIRGESDSGSIAEKRAAAEKEPALQADEQMRKIKEKVDHISDPELREKLQGAFKSLREAIESGNHEAAKKIMGSIESALRDASTGSGKEKQ